MTETQNLSLIRRKLHLGIAGVLGTVEELRDQPNNVLDGGYTSRARHDPCECNLVDGKEAFREMLIRIDDAVNWLSHAHREYERTEAPDQTMLLDVEYALEQSQAAIKSILEAQEEWDETITMEVKGPSMADIESILPF